MEKQRVIYQYKSGGELVKTFIGQNKAAKELMMSENEIIEACKSGILLNGFYFRFVRTSVFYSSTRNYILKIKK